MLFQREGSFLSQLLFFIEICCFRGKEAFSLNYCPSLRYVVSERRKLSHSTVVLRDMLFQRAGSFLSQLLSFIAICCFRGKETFSLNCCPSRYVVSEGRKLSISTVVLHCNMLFQREGSFLSIVVIPNAFFSGIVCFLNNLVLNGRQHSFTIVSKMECALIRSRKQVWYDGEGGGVWGRHLTLASNISILTFQKVQGGGGKEFTFSPPHKYKCSPDKYCLLVGICKQNGPFHLKSVANRVSIHYLTS